MAPYAALLQLSLLGLAGHVSAAAIDTRSLTPYAPVSASCPSTPLVRTANSLGSDEAAYIAARKPLADAALTAWLQKTDSTFGTTNLPTVGLVLSGGGYRALLSGAGLVQGLDARDSDLPTSGLLQALTYETSLSGGAWFSASWTGLNWPTISYLRDNVWSEAFADSLLVPARLLSAVAYAEIVGLPEQSPCQRLTDTRQGQRYCRQSQGWLPAYSYRCLRQIALLPASQHQLARHPH